MELAEGLGLELGPSGSVVEYLENSKYMAYLTFHVNWLMCDVLMWTDNIIEVYSGIVACVAIPLHCQHLS